MADDLREKLARALMAHHGQAGMTATNQWILYLREADAVLAVVDPDGLRDENRRLRSRIPQRELLADFPVEHPAPEPAAAHHASCERKAFHDPSETPCTWREPLCVERWPGCHDDGYDPRCCRFPKSCSVDDVPVPTTPEAGQ